MSNGKGSRPRPMSVSREQFSRNWDRAFGGQDWANEVITQDEDDDENHDCQENDDSSLPTLAGECTPA